MSLAEFAVVAFARIYSHRSAKRVALRKKQIRLFEKIREDTIYGGEMFVHPDHRRSGIGNVLVQYGIICAFWYWPSARYMFAFMEKESECPVSALLTLQLSVRFAAIWSTDVVFLASSVLRA